VTKVLVVHVEPNLVDRVRGYLDHAVAFRDALTQSLLVSTAAAVFAAMAASLFVTGRIVGPLRRLAAASRRIADGHYAERVPVSSADELGELAQTFNAMADALEDTERRRRELIGDVAHELRTPIATLEARRTGWLSSRARLWNPYLHRRFIARLRTSLSC
jgi:HAMP domain-containing protein